jgi:hypothetical protein
MGAHVPKRQARCVRRELSEVFGGLRRSIYKATLRRNRNEHGCFGTLNALIGRSYLVHWKNAGPVLQISYLRSYRSLHPYPPNQCVCLFCVDCKTCTSTRRSQMHACSRWGLSWVINRSAPKGTTFPISSFQEANQILAPFA